MRKLTLDLDALAVESFTAGDVLGRPGTVKARVDDATIGGRTCVNDGSTCGAFCVQNQLSFDPNQGCGSIYQNWTGQYTCFAYAGCASDTQPTYNNDSCFDTCQSCMYMCRTPVC